MSRDTSSEAVRLLADELEAGTIVLTCGSVDLEYDAVRRAREIRLSLILYVADEITAKDSECLQWLERLFGVLRS